MKIVLVIPTLKQGGAERVMSVLANIWSAQGHNIHLILLAGGEKFYSLEDCVTVHHLGFINNGPINKILNELKTFIKLRKLLKQIHPDFILSFMIKYNVLTIMAASFLNINIFVSDRSNPRKKLPLFITLLRRLTYKYAKGAIAQTTLAKEIIENETGNKNIQVIHNPLKNIELIDIPKEKIILNVGRLIPEKGQKYLLEAFAKIDDQDWKLVILGDGPLRHDLEKQAKSLGIFNRVEMPGSVKNVDEWLAKSSIFAFSSISEGFPNALAEAMSAGLPCISFDCDAGPRDIIKDNISGYLVPLYDVATFSKKLENLIKDKNLRTTMGKEASKIRGELEPSMIADKFLNFCSVGKI